MKAILFPGQGSQLVGMGFSVAKKRGDFISTLSRYLSEADRVLGFPLSRIIESGPEEKLGETENTQPALFAISAAYLDYARRSGRVEAFDFVAGHSLGEYTALFAAGAFDFETGIRVVRERGRAMQGAVPVGVGAMGAVVGLERGKIELLCERVSGTDEIVEPAAFNTGDQTVVAGHSIAVSRLLEAAKSDGARMVTLLKVSMPSHCRLMQPAQEKLSNLLSSIPISPLSIPYVPNATGEISKDPEKVRQNLIDQLIKPVRWVQTVQALIAGGVSDFLEVGPGKVLFGFQRKIAPSASNEFIEQQWLR